LTALIYFRKIKVKLNVLSIDIHVQSITFEAIEKINISNCYNSFISVKQGMNCLKNLKTLIKNSTENKLLFIAVDFFIFCME
jgi:hypothetical protein